jgi:acyl carrier protein
MTTLQKVRELLSALAPAPSSDDAPLEVESVVLVQLAEALEDTFGFRLSPLELVPENFETLRRIAAFVDGRLAARKGPSR